MPPLFILLHLGLSIAAAALALRVLARRPRLAGAVALDGVALAILGLVAERWQPWTWALLSLGWRDMVFGTNLSVEGAALLGTALWSRAASPGERLRAGVFLPLLIGAALFSYAWYFAPVPSPLTNQVDKDGVYHQTSDISCSAAAAATLLRHYSILATESEMARLCLTRARLGTSLPGLYRGVALRAASAELVPRVVRVHRVGALHRISPGLLSIGLLPGAPAAIVQRMQEYGWEPGQHHTVVVLDADPNGRWLDIADPSIGKERWPSGDIEYIWDGHVIVLTKL